MDVGIRSNKLTDIITPEAKDNEQPITLLVFLNLINKGTTPNNVEIPARKLITKAKFILSPFNYMKLKR